MRVLSLASFMVPQHRRLGVRRLAILPAVLTTVVSLSLVSGCDKVPLLAPNGSVITLFPTSTTIPLNGSTEIVATVIENGVTATPPTPPANGGAATPGASTGSPGAGTPVQNGTLVSFTTTLGKIEPSEARTHNGQVSVRFITGSASGTATITAFSRSEERRVGKECTHSSATLDTDNSCDMDECGT